MSSKNLVLLAALPLFSQVAPPPLAPPEEPRVLAATVTFNHQPPEVFKGSFLSMVKGVGIYQATVCNLAQVGLKVSEGQIMQAAERGTVVNGKRITVATISPVLALPMIARARKQSKMYAIATFLEWAGWAGSALVTGQVFPNIGKAGFVFPLVVSASGRVQQAYAADGADLTVVSTMFLNPERSIVLEARGCASRVFLGEYRGGFAPFEVSIK